MTPNPLRELARLHGEAIKAGGRQFPERDPEFAPSQPASSDLRAAVTGLEVDGDTPSWFLGFEECRAAVLRLLDTAQPDLRRTPEIAWLIERGQPEKQVPTVWWSNRERWGLTYMDDWTTDAFKAARFDSKEDAEQVIGQKFTPPVGAPSARAVEHGFVPDLRRTPEAEIELLRTALHVRCQPTTPCELPRGYEDAVIEAYAKLAATPAPR